MAQTSVTPNGIVNVAANSILGNNTGSSRKAVQLTADEVRTLIELNTTDNASFDTITATTSVASNHIGSRSEGYVLFGYKAANRGMALDDSGYYFKHIDSGQFLWSSTANVLSATDLGISRASDGLLEVNNGTPGTLRDVRARKVYVDSTDAHFAGDTVQIYYRQGTTNYVSFDYNGVRLANASGVAWASTGQATSTLDAMLMRGSSGPTVDSRAAGGFRSRTLDGSAAAPISGSLITATGGWLYFESPVSNNGALRQNGAYVESVRGSATAYTPFAASHYDVGGNRDAFVYRNPTGPAVQVQAAGGLRVMDLAGTAEAPVRASNGIFTGQVRTDVINNAANAVSLLTYSGAGNIHYSSASTALMSLNSANRVLIGNPIPTDDGSTLLQVAGAIKASGISNGSTITNLGGTGGVSVGSQAADRIDIALNSNVPRFVGYVANVSTGEFGVGTSNAYLYHASGPVILRGTETQIKNAAGSADAPITAGAITASGGVVIANTQSLSVDGGGSNSLQNSGGYLVVRNLSGGNGIRFTNSTDPNGTYSLQIDNSRNATFAGAITASGISNGSTITNLGGTGGVSVGSQAATRLDILLSANVPRLDSYVAGTLRGSLGLGALSSSLYHSLGPVILRGTQTQIRNAADSADGDLTVKAITASGGINGATDLLLSSTTGSNTLALDGNGCSIRTNGTYRWSVNANGHLTPFANNTYDIGSSTNYARQVHTIGIKSSGMLALNASGTGYGGISTGANGFWDTDTFTVRSSAGTTRTVTDATGLTVTGAITASGTVTGNIFRAPNSVWIGGATGTNVHLYGSASGQLGIYNSAETSSVMIDVSTDNVAKFRNVGNTLDAAITAGAITASGVIKGANGSVIAGNGPGISFIDHVNTGIAANYENFAIWESGTIALNLSSAIKEFRVPSDFKFAFSSATNNNAASDTNFYRSSAGVLGTPGAIVVGGAITASGDIEVSDIGEGFILKSPDGTRYRITVADGGALSAVAV